VGDDVQFALDTEPGTIGEMDHCEPPEVDVAAEPVERSVQSEADEGTEDAEESSVDIVSERERDAMRRVCIVRRVDRPRGEA
jgi:hypothetical protein